jgi:hypothetical protein
VRIGDEAVLGTAPLTLPFIAHLPSLLSPSMPTLRDPLWNNIRVDGPYLRLLDSAAFQRLRYVRQLGLAHLVYPGATHSRFEHALGAFHLAQETVRVMGASGALDGSPAGEGPIVVAAALLHGSGTFFLPPSANQRYDTGARFSSLGAGTT